MASSYQTEKEKAKMAAEGNYKAEVKVYFTDGVGEIMSFNVRAKDPIALRKKVAVMMETLVDEETEV